MTSQEMVERDLRILIGDLQVQLIIVRAQLAEKLEEEAARATTDATAKLNGGGRPSMAAGEGINAV